MRGGDLAITLPRFAAPNGTVLGSSLYGDDPNTAYSFWQRRGLLRFGHWVFGLHHELITVGLTDAVRLELTGEMHLLKWLLKTIEGLNQEATKRGIQSIIIYPHHEVT